MTHDELKEAVARAAYESMAAVANEYDPPWSKLSDDEKEPFRETAALFQSAIREAGFAIVPVDPTPAMVIDGGLAWANEAEKLKSVEHTMVDLAAACYQAMLKAARETER